MGDFRHNQSYEAASTLGGLKSYAVSDILLSRSLSEHINHSPTVQAAPVEKMHLSRGEREVQPDVPMPTSLSQDMKINDQLDRPDIGWVILQTSS